MVGGDVDVIGRWSTIDAGRIGRAPRRRSARRIRGGLVARRPSSSGRRAVRARRRAARLGAVGRAPLRLCAPGTARCCGGGTSARRSRCSCLRSAGTPAPSRGAPRCGSSRRPAHRASRGSRRRAESRSAHSMAIGATSTKGVMGDRWSPAASATPRCAHRLTVAATEPVDPPGGLADGEGHGWFARCGGVELLGPGQAQLGGDPRPGAALVGGDDERRRAQPRSLPSGPMTRRMRSSASAAAGSSTQATMPTWCWSRR